MLQQFPSISFNEKVVGPRPSRTFLMEAVGIVGQFVRGFYNKAFACDSEEAFKRYGKRNLLNGDVGMGAVYSQGGTQFVLSPVHGAGKQASITLTLKGKMSAAGKPSITVHDARPTVPVDTVFVPAEDLAIDTTALAALTALRDLINVEGSPVTAAAPAGTAEDATMVLTCKTYEALESGELTAYFTGSSTSPVAGLTGAYPISTTAVADKTLVGGYSAPSQGTATLKNMDDEDAVTLTYHYVGDDSKNVVARVLEGSLPTKRTIEIVHLIDGITDVMKDVDLTDVEDEDLLVSSKGNFLAEARVLKSTAALKVTTTDVAFSEGSNGAPVSDADYLRAIDALELEPCTYVIAPGEMPAGVSRSAVESALVSHVLRVESELGEAYTLRTAVTYAPRGMVEADIPTVTVPDSDRVVKVAGWATCQFAPKLKRYGVSPDALYVGKALRTPRHVSMAALEGAPSFQGVVAVDTPVGNKAWNKLTAYRMDAIIKDPVIKTYVCLNGRTTASDPKACYWHCFRREMDYLRMKVFQAVYRKKSSPMGNVGDEVYEGIVNGILREEMKNSFINGYDPCISNDSNNPIEVRASGKRVADFGVEFVPPQDQTELNVSRVMRATVRA